jgi:TolB-like protein/Tfp pilus assembly protein PilF
VEFPSVVDAVECALAIQKALAAESGKIRLRIGINLGDIIIDGDDIYGDGVNVAARLEALAEPGGIAISRMVLEGLGNRVEAVFSDAGEHQVKNVARPIRVWRWSSAPVDMPYAEAMSLSERPSIAVLPFQNLSGDTEQDYFADGMVEEIITALSRMHWLLVIARNSSFTYKGKAVDVKRAGRELGVRYVLEGSVRKAWKRVRVTGQLIDTATAAHIWADRFDGDLEDIFDLQDQVTASVVGAIAPRLEQAEIERAKRKPTNSLDAYDCFLRGMACVHRWTREANNEALQYFARAIQLDPDFATAYGMAARCYSQRKVSGWEIDRAKESAEAERLARRAAALGRDDAVALCAAGMALAYVVGDLDGGAVLIERARPLNPNLAWAGLFSGWVNAWLGQPEIAIERLERAMIMSPHDPHFYNMQAATASAHFVAGHYSDASSWAERAAREQPNHLIAACIVAASAALEGRLKDAQAAMARLRQLDPKLRGADLRHLIPLRRLNDLAQLKEGLHKAGLPD